MVGAKILVRKLLTEENEGTNHTTSNSKTQNFTLHPNLCCFCFSENTTLVREAHLPLDAYFGS